VCERPVRLGLCLSASERNVNGARLYERVDFVVSGLSAAGLKTMEFHFDD